jgi:thioester reductase-like protein
MAARTILLTGFPGFIGTRLARRLLSDDPEARLIALVEARLAERARQIASGEGLERVELLVGDIVHPRLGLDEATYGRLAREVTSVHHLAAVYDLAVGAALAERVNVQGTGHVLDLCLVCERLARHNYVSTAYVAGTRSGRVLESELAAGQSFKNHYESTKFAAEVLVRATMDRVPTTIYRPAIVVGDSRTGETQKFDGPYYLLRLLSRVRRTRGPIPQIGRGDAPFNVVPVDFVIDAIAAVARDPAGAGETLHLVDPEPSSAAELMRILASEYAGRAPAYRLPSELVERSLRFAPVRRMLDGTPRESIVYLNHPVTFDTTRATALLERNGLRCPRFPEYAPNIVRFFREHEDDPGYAPAGDDHRAAARAWSRITRRLSPPARARSARAR